VDSVSLRNRWDSLCARVGAFKRVEESDLTFDMLLALYTHPARAYHNLDHIAQVLAAFDDVRGLAEDKDCVEFAIWMHDCVYIAERPDNEERSADAASMIAGLLGCTPEFIAHVRSLIAVTRHSVPPARGDWALIADLDLAILAAPWEPSPQDAGGGGAGAVMGYNAYRKAIRREFAFATDDQFIAGRTAFLQRMLERDRVFHTAYFHQRLDRAARENMERELDELAKGRFE
jgi:predicted metal-dependent HD superfamily phosphohydrolase